MWNERHPPRDWRRPFGGLALLHMLFLAGCGDAPQTGANLHDGGSAVDADIRAEDGGGSVDDVGPHSNDVGARSDTGPAQHDCSAIVAHENWRLCDATPDSCAAVFYDGAGCHEVCSAVGLDCAQIKENVDNACRADEARPALGCDVITGHDSDFCVCRGPVTEPPQGRSATEPYEDLFDELVGFGAATTGGKGGVVCTVTTRSNSGAGSLRNCIGSADGPTWVRFAVDGDIRLNSNIALPNNITIDARGRTIRIFGGGMIINRRSNVILTNLIFKEGARGDDQDAVQVKTGHKIWVHHCSFSNYSDGLIDLTKGTKDVTLSWNKFSDHDKVILISANDNDTQDRNTRVTLHHNWFKETKQRHPRVRHAKVHVYNNFFDQWRYYGLGCSTNSQCYSEKNVYQAGTNLRAIITRVGEDRGSGKVESHGDLFLGLATHQERGSVFTPSDFYRYTADRTNGLAARIEARAGAQSQ